MRKFLVSCTEVHTATYEIEVESEGDTQALIEARKKWEQLDWDKAKKRTLQDSSDLHIEEVLPPNPVYAEITVGRTAWLGNGPGDMRINAEFNKQVDAHTWNFWVINGGWEGLLTCDPETGVLSVRVVATGTVHEVIILELTEKTTKSHVTRDEAEEIPY